MFCSENACNEIEVLLHTVILPHCNFHAGNAAHLFRKVAINCLCAMLHYDRLYIDDSNRITTTTINTTTITKCTNSDASVKSSDNLVPCDNGEDELLHKVIIA